MRLPILIGMLCSLFAVVSCDSKGPHYQAGSPPRALPPERTDMIFADNYARLFVSECHKHAVATANGNCERLLHSERAKQVWAGQAYAEAHATPLDVGNGPDGAKWKAFRMPDRKEVYAAIPYVPDPSHADQPWIRLVDMRNLSDDEADKVEAAFTRTQHIKWQDLKK